MAKSQLTPRQKEIKGLQKQGKNAREIAAELGITENAVYQQLRRARQVTGEAKPAAAKPKAKAAAKSGRKSAAKPAATAAVAATPAPAAANRQVKSEPRVMTPLQAIRARRDEASKGLRDAEAAVTEAKRALAKAEETRDKIQAKVTPELTQLDNAEAALKATETATASEPEAPAAEATATEAPVEPVAAKPAAKPASKPAAKQAAKPAAKPAAAKSNGNGKDAASTPKPTSQAEREATADEADPFAEGEKMDAVAAQEAATTA
jgi:hypothetical protein